MAMLLTNYAAVRDALRPGDVLAFGGTNPLSVLIKATANSPVSHAAIVTAAATGAGDAVLAESTVELSSPPVFGVHQAAGGAIVGAYKGAVWWLPLERNGYGAHFNQAGFSQFIKDARARPFDVLGGLRVVLSDLVDLLRALRAAQLFDSDRDVGALFCSELVAGALVGAGIVTTVPPVDPADVSPTDLCAWRIYEPDYHHLRGAQAPIGTFATRAPGAVTGTHALHRRTLLQQAAQQRLAEILVSDPLHAHALQHALDAMLK